MIMKMFEIMQELTKCDTKMLSKQILLENGSDGLVQCKVATNLQLVKKKNKNSAKYNKMRGAYSWSPYHLGSLGSAQ